MYKIRGWKNEITSLLHNIFGQCSEKYYYFAPYFERLYRRTGESHVDQGRKKMARLSHDRLEIHFMSLILLCAQSQPVCMQV